MNPLIRIDSKAVSDQLNRCYLDWHPGYPSNVNTEWMNGFKYYIERTAGLRIYFVEQLDKTGRFGFRLDTVEVTDPKKYTMFLLKWA